MAIVGIGGVFFRARDPGALQAWYEDHLGLATSEYGEWQQQAGPSVFMPFASDTDKFPADKQFMLNFRVDDLEKLLTKLRGGGVEVITKPEWDAPEVGRFALVHDPEGNAVELWEPPVEDEVAQ
jgi:predicted enzyme related to lactoylglutathione lyase